MSPKTLRSLLLVAMVVCSAGLGTVAFSTSAVAQQPLADAPPGTVFGQVLRGGDANDTEPVGLVKRGRSGASLYNPATERVRLAPGDVLVARNGDRYDVNRTQSLAGSAGAVGPGATVLQGEQDTRFVGFASDTLVGAPEQGAEGQTLDLNQTVPVDQEPGVYRDPANPSLQVTVGTPRIARLEVINRNGQRIDAGGEVEEDEFVVVRADVNFLGVEPAQLSLVDPRTGSTITDGVLTRAEAIERFPDRAEFLRNLVPEGKADPEGRDRTVRSLANPALNPQDTIYLIQDLGEVDRAGTYEYQVVPEDDEPFGDLGETGLQRRVPLFLVSADEPELDLFQTSATAVQGELLTYRVQRSSAGTVHVVSVAAADLRTPPSGPTEVGEVTRVFRQFDDGGFLSGVLLEDGTVVLEDGRRFEDGAVAEGAATVEGGDVSQVFTLVEVDADGFGVNQVDTGLLDDATVDLNLFPGASSADGAISAYETTDGRDEVEELSVRITEGREGFELLAPGATYVAGREVDVEGVANPAIDAVAVYARDEEDWELIEPSLARVSVRADGTWEESDVALSRESRVLRVPGSYRIGVIDVEDADRDGDGRADPTLTSSEFSSGTSVQRGIRVVGQELGGAIRTYGGQVAVEDAAVNVSGSAPGAEEVVVAFVGDRGSTVVTRVSVDEDDRFDDDDVSLGDEDGLLEEGAVRGFVLSPARDGVFGTVGQGPDSTAELVAFLEDLERRGLTQDQVVSLLLDETIDDAGSDDLLLETPFQLTDADTQVRAVVPASRANETGVQDVRPGDTMVVRGTTNLRPDDNTIVLEMFSGPEAERFESAVADEWGTDGVWSTRLAVPEDVAPGTYVLRVDDGQTITSVEVDVVEQAAGTATPAETPVETPPGTPTATATPSPSPTPSPTPTSSPSPTTTAAEGSGFGALLGLLAVLLAAILLGRG